MYPGFRSIQNRGARTKQYRPLVNPDPSPVLLSVVEDCNIGGRIDCSPVQLISTLFLDSTCDISGGRLLSLLTIAAPQII